MPRRLLRLVTPGATKSKAKKATFRERYDELEEMRTSLLQRLDRLGETGRTHPSHRRALVLLNETFRRAAVAQRLAVLQAAAWVIELIERSAGLI